MIIIILKGLSSERGPDVQAGTGIVSPRNALHLGCVVQEIVRRSPARQRSRPRPPIRTSERVPPSAWARRLVDPHPDALRSIAEVGDQGARTGSEVHPEESAVPLRSCLFIRDQEGSGLSRYRGSRAGGPCS